MPEFETEYIWKCPNPFEKSFLKDPDNSDRVMDMMLYPAIERIQEMMVRDPIAKLCDLMHPVLPTFKDMGGVPYRYRIQRGKPEKIEHVIIIFDENENQIGSVLNGDYETSHDLIQISQRLNPGMVAPTFEVAETFEDKNELVFFTFKITMSGYDPNNYEYQVSQKSDLTNAWLEPRHTEVFEPPNPIAAI